MTSHTSNHASKKKIQAVKASPQVKTVRKPEPVGLSREEMRHIVLEMIG